VGKGLNSASFDDFNDQVRARALGAVMWGCMPAVGVLELLFACAHCPGLHLRRSAAKCGGHGHVLFSHALEFGSLCAACVPHTVGTRGSSSTAASAMHILAEPRLSNTGFQVWSLEHRCSRLHAHSLNPGDSYASRHDSHGMLSVSA
jgi:hypothetical protein